MEKTVDVIENLVQAISVLNKTEEYFQSLDGELSKCDSSLANYEHFIEFKNINEVNLKELFTQMQEIYNKRRVVKNDITLRATFELHRSKLNNIANREMFVQFMKNAKAKIPNTYTYDLISNENMAKLCTVKKVGRPRKDKM